MMVKVRNPKKQTVLTTLTRNRHSLNLLVLCGLGLLCGVFVVLQNRKNRGASGHPEGFPVAMAHSAKNIVSKPHLIYGTAWKKEETARLVSLAVKTGFRFIDTACQPKHYNEGGVGNGWTAAAQELGLTRADMWLQTKYTPYGGQDPNTVPYDPDSPIETQVRTSLEVSLKNLRTDYLDSWVIHSPFSDIEDTLAAWRAMEEAVDAGKVMQLGISNCYDMETFTTLYQEARHKPKVLQNRFHAETDFDTDLRAFCRDNGIRYQSFWTLTANRKALATPEARKIADAKGLTPQTYLYAFLMSLGYVTPLSGTTSLAHMGEDVAVMERIQGGDLTFSEQEQQEFAKILGMPGM